MLNAARSYADWVVNEELFISLQGRRSPNQSRPEGTVFSLNRELTEVYRSLLVYVDNSSRTAVYLGLTEAHARGVRVALTAFDYNAVYMQLAPTWPRLAPKQNLRVHRNTGRSNAPLKPTPGPRPTLQRSITMLERIVSLSKEIRTQSKQMNAEVDEDLRHAACKARGTLEFLQCIQHHLGKLLGLFDILILASEQVLKLLNTLPKLTEHLGIQGTPSNSRGPAYAKGLVTPYKVSSVIYPAYETNEASPPTMIHLRRC